MATPVSDTALRTAALGSTLRITTFVASLIVAFLLTPFVVHSLGQRAYGFWLFVGAFIGYYGVFDLGLATAVSRHLAGALGRGAREDCRRIFSTALQAYALLGALVFLVTCGFSLCSPLFARDAQEAALFANVIAILGVGVALEFALKPYFGLLEALVRFDVMAGLEILTLVLRMGLIVGLLAGGYGVMALAWVSLLSGMPARALGVSLSRRFLPWLRFRRQPFWSTTTKTLFGYSFFMWIVKLGDSLRFGFDSLVITAFLGFASLTPFGIAASVASRFRDLMMALLGVLQPTYSRLEGNGDHDAIKRTLFFASKVAMCISTFVGFALIAWGKPFIERWIGPAYLDAYPCLAVLVLGWTINFWQSPSVSLMFATSRHKYYAATNMIEAVANLLLSLWWVLPLGILGVALGTAVPMIFVRLLLHPYYICKVTGIATREYRTMFLRNIWRTSAGLVVPMAVALAFRPAGYLQMTMAVAIAAPAYGVTAWFLLFAQEERSRLMALVTGGRKTAAATAHALTQLVSAERAPKHMPRSPEAQVGLFERGSRKVSVLVPTYNRSAFLKGTLESVFEQTVSVHEVLLVDDGSTDETARVVEALLVEHSDWKGRLRYVHQDNRGKSVALNVGLQLATGDWIAFNDSDDQWLPQKLELQFRALGQYPEAGACFTDVRYTNNPKMRETAFGESQRHYNTTFGKETNAPFLFTLGWPGIFMQTILVSRDTMREVGEFDTSIRMSMDADFVFRLGLATPLCFVNEPLVELDRTEERTIGLTTQYPPLSLRRQKVHEQLLTKWLSLVSESHPGLRYGLLKVRSSTQSAIANIYILQDECESARSVLRRAMRQNSEARLVLKWLLTALAPGLLQKEIRRREAGRPRSKGRKSWLWAPLSKVRAPREAR